MLTERHMSREDEERIWIISIGPLVPVTICIIAYFAHLKSIGVIQSDRIMLTYVLLIGVLILATGAGIYEVASSFKVKKPVSFRAKRFLSRVAFSSAYVLGFYALWNLFTLSLSSVLKEEYIVILSLLTASLALGILLLLSKTGGLIKKLTQEDN